MSSGDRNFDDLVEHFSGKIYGQRGQQGTVSKGQLRYGVIQRDLASCLPQLGLDHGSVAAPKPWQILDVGAGLGQWCLALSALGHRVSYNDISAKMMQAAKQALQQQLPPEHFETLQWLSKPYQELGADIADHSQDLILCHALIEWLEQPEPLMAMLYHWLKPGAYLSLCHYNPAGKRLRNLIFGNFKAIERDLAGQSPPPSHQRGGLTPSFPSTIQDIDQWWQEAGFRCCKQSGIRSFSDFNMIKRGGFVSPEAVFDMELAVSEDPDLLHCARYRHLILQKPI